MGGGSIPAPKETSERASFASPGVLGIDTDALVHWAMAGAPYHRAVRRCFTQEVEQGRRLGLTLQVLQEFVHVATDTRRFEHPLSMQDALRLSLELWRGREVERILPTTRAHDRLCELMQRLQLGRQRILDTALAVTLETAGVRRLATLNGRDFEVFPFLEIVDPTSGQGA
jgi:predicted nucleic acid-binding protein